ncbi:hypothetical protein DPMN_141963 [Dreissena polymorpha]|uniref:Uncharacterized protein n=1 Tax=Dreissena polymorpha TaxID=45954 RepID=A0A9D4JN20_DREPO|nr:hypothetical protein DPMN_141963 [Dreissena polymorpha]
MTTVRQYDGDSATIRWRQCESTMATMRERDSTIATMRQYDDDSATIRLRECDRRWRLNALRQWRQYDMTIALKPSYYRNVAIVSWHF